MIAKFVLVISMTSPITNWEYKGHFINCDQAHLYVQLNYPAAKETKCIVENYIYLPESLKKRTIRLHDDTEGFLSFDM